MDSERPLTAGEGRFLAVFLGALPAIYLGFQVGSFAAGIGSPQAFVSIFIRALVCAAPAALLAAIMPRGWILPALIYGYGFYCGYTLADSIEAAMFTLIAHSMAVFTGQRLETSLEPTHPELLWFFVIALWLAAFISFLRRHYSHPEECI